MIKEIKQQWHVYVFICFASVQYIILEEIVPAHETNSTQSLLKLFDSSLLSPLKTLLVRGCRFRSSFVHWNWTELPGGETCWWTSLHSPQTQLCTPPCDIFKDNSNFDPNAIEGHTGHDLPPLSLAGYLHSNNTKAMDHPSGTTQTQQKGRLKLAAL